MFRRGSGFGCGTCLKSGRTKPIQRLENAIAEQATSRKCYWAIRSDSAQCWILHDKLAFK